MRRLINPIELKHPSQLEDSLHFLLLSLLVGGGGNAMVIQLDPLSDSIKLIKADEVRAH